MRTKILLLSAILFMSANLVHANATVSEISSEQDLKNYGYSDKIIEASRLYKCRATGQKCLSDDEIKYGNASKPVKWVRKFFMYLDPALENDPPMMHRTNINPSVNDF